MNEQEQEKLAIKRMYNLWNAVSDIVKYHNSGDYTDEGAINSLKDAFDYAKNLQ